MKDFNEIVIYFGSYWSINLKYVIYSELNVETHLTLSNGGPVNFNIFLGLQEIEFLKLFDSCLRREAAVASLSHVYCIERFHVADIAKLTFKAGNVNTYVICIHEFVCNCYLRDITYRNDRDNSNTLLP